MQKDSEEEPKSGANMIEVIMMSGEEEEVNENFTGWEVVTVNPNLIEIDLNF